MILFIPVLVVILVSYAGRWLSQANRQFIEDYQRKGLPHPADLPSSTRLRIGWKLAAIMLATGFPFAAWLVWILVMDSDLEPTPSWVIGTVFLITLTVGVLLVNIAKNRLLLKAAERHKQQPAVDPVPETLSNRRFIPAGFLSLGLVIVFGLLCTIFYGQIAHSRPRGAADFPTPELAVAIPATERVALTVSTTRALNIPPAPPNVSVYFVPIGNLSIVDVPYLVGYYQQRLGLRITPLPAIPLGRTYNPRRRQNQADALLQSMQDEYAKIANDGRSILIGLTEADIYTSDRNWRFALGLRDEDRFAVVSSARMDLDHVNYGAPIDYVGLHTRLTKMISRELGFMYYRLRTSRDPRSVMRSSIMGVDELDELGEDF